MFGVCDVCGDKASFTRCEAHYRCDDCGSATGLCTYSEGVLCDKCHSTRVSARIASFDGQTEYTEEVVCPYCGYIHSDGWEYDDGEVNCCDCDNIFTLARNTEVTYTTTKE